MRSMVLVPIDPVAPRIVTRLTPGAGIGFDRASVAVIVSPYQQATRGIVEAAADDADDAADERRRPETIEPVHHTAMTRNKVARVLGAEPALEPGFQKIPELRHHRQ